MTSVAGGAVARVMACKFHGALVGALIGDCIGARFENIENVELSQVRKHIGDIEAKATTNLLFTDDTAMARSIANSLIHEKSVNSRDIAVKFVKEFHTEQWRGYGLNVTTVFEKLKDNKYKDVTQPAREQFNGRGSFGNGGAMRIVPLALFYSDINDQSKLAESVREITKITHYNDEAIDGALLQCTAVQLALQYNPSDKHITSVDFLNKLKNIFSQYGSSSLSVQQSSQSTSASLYIKKLGVIEQFLKDQKNTVIQTDSVVQQLGHDVSALGSVPAALYSFLRYVDDQSIAGDKMPDKMKSFEKSIIYAISLGGDTDTIATMAGAIAGAFYGIDDIPRSWCDACEGVDTALHQADSLFQLVSHPK